MQQLRRSCWKQIKAFFFYCGYTFRACPYAFIQGCDLIVALTHMRDPNDLRLAQEVPEIHLILGGHDHHYFKQQVRLFTRQAMVEVQCI